MNEADFLALLRPLAVHPAARGLRDDAAVLRPPKDGDLVFTHDMLVEDVHYRSGDAPEDVAWKLLAVNLSDLAAKGAAPVGVLLGYSLGEDDWDARFAAGLGEALAQFDVALLGGDTVASAGPRTLSLTALGRATGPVPDRRGACVGDGVWITGSIGRAGLGLAGNSEHLQDYLRPRPRLTEGRALAWFATAMMDVSDGLLIDAQRLAEASGVAIAIDLAAVPHVGELMAAVTAGDDYELLFTLPKGAVPPVAATHIGIVASGSGLTLRRDGVAVPLPSRLGWQHEG